MVYFLLLYLLYLVQYIYLFPLSLQLRRKPFLVFNDMDRNMDISFDAVADDDLVAHLETIPDLSVVDPVRFYFKHFLLISSLTDRDRILFDLMLDRVGGQR